MRDRNERKYMLTFTTKKLPSTSQHARMKSISVSECLAGEDDDDITNISTHPYRPSDPNPSDHLQY
jgi:hypothetical protein